MVGDEGMQVDVTMGIGCGLSAGDRIQPVEQVADIVLNVDRPIGRMSDDRSQQCQRPAQPMPEFAWRIAAIEQASKPAVIRLQLAMRSMSSSGIMSSPHFGRPDEDMTRRIERVLSTPARRE
jgi:hypothetical protein